MKAIQVRTTFTLIAISVFSVMGLAGLATVVETFDTAPDPVRWVRTGDANWDAACEALFLTPAQDGKAGSIFWSQSFFAERFDVSFDFWIGGGSGADGLTFAWVRGPGFLGGNGTDLGFYGLDGYAVKFDTYSFVSGEPDNYLAIIEGTQSSTSGGFKSNDTIPGMENVLDAAGNPAPFHVDIRFNAGHLEMWMSNSRSATPMPDIEVLDSTIPGYAPFNAYFGFTAATGGLNNIHSIDNVVINHGPHWARSYPIEETIFFNAAVKTRDHNFITLGNVQSALGGRCLIMGLQPDGTIDWQRVYDHIPFATCIEEVDGEYFVAGYTPEGGKAAALVMKMDAQGTPLWTKKYASTEHHITPGAIVESPDKGVAIAGRIEEINPPNNKDFWVMKLHPDGNIAWQNAYVYKYDNGASHADGTATSIARTRGQGRYFVAGHIYSPLSDNDPWMIEVDNSGVLQSQRRLDGSKNDQVTDVTGVWDPVEEDVFVVTGFTDTVPGAGFKMFAAKMGITGGLLWSKAYSVQGPGGLHYAYSIDQTTDGGLLMVGSLENPITQSLDGAILMLNSTDGFPNWCIGYGGKGYEDGFYYVEGTAGNEFVVAGYTKSFPPTEFTDPFTGQKTYTKNAWVMNLDRNGEIDKTNNDDACMRSKLDVQAEPIDWVFNCLPDAKQEVQTPPVSVTDVAPSISESEIKSVLLCKELWTKSLTIKKWPDAVELLWCCVCGPKLFEVQYADKLSPDMTWNTFPETIDCSGLEKATYLDLGAADQRARFYRIKAVGEQGL